MKDVNAISNLVMHGKSAEVRSLSCPKCSGSLRIGVYRSTRLVSAQVKCKNCDFIVRLDGSPPEPPWVGELGLAFETTP
jgi:RNase P subunit RPR2